MTQALVTRNQTLALPLPTGSLDQYIHAAFKIPVLSAEMGQLSLQKAA